MSSKRKNTPIKLLARGDGSTLPPQSPPVRDDEDAASPDASAVVDGPLPLNMMMKQGHGRGVKRPFASAADDEHCDDSDGASADDGDKDDDANLMSDDNSDVSNDAAVGGYEQANGCYDNGAGDDGDVMTNIRALISTSDSVEDKQRKLSDVIAQLQRLQQNLASSFHASAGVDDIIKHVRYIMTLIIY